MADEGPDEPSCGEKVAFATIFSGAAGCFIGALQASWMDVPAVMRNQSWPALYKTGAMTGAGGMHFAAIGGVFAAAACQAEYLRGKQDIWNGVIGGFAAGQVIALKTKSIGMGVGAGFAFAVVSAAIDTTGHTVRQGGDPFDDGATPARIHFPYKQLYVPKP
mmetsp:Transcript_8378/g.21176  ORF Transcript_8378/g.21176 Transcript_8378/m.21176 type:complete len:162 (+) Transcript_8378:220-705(+)